MGLRVQLFLKPVLMNLNFLVERFILQNKSLLLFPLLPPLKKMCQMQFQIFLEVSANNLIPDKQVDHAPPILYSNPKKA